jgi:hypothetical protein
MSGTGGSNVARDETRKMMKLTLLVVGACWSAAIIINVVFRPTGVPYAMFNMTLVVLAGELHRGINKAGADGVRKWSSATFLVVLVLSGLEYSLFHVQRPYSIIVWMIAWEVAEVIMVFRFQKETSSA